MLHCQLNGKSVEVLWDTGSMVTLVDRRWIKENFPEAKVYSVGEFLEDKELNLKAANSTQIRFDGVAILELVLGMEKEGRSRHNETKGGEEEGGGRNERILHKTDGE